MLNAQIEKDRKKNEENMKRMKQSSATFITYEFERNDSMLDKLAKDQNIEFYPSIIEKNLEFSEIF